MSQMNTVFLSRSGNHLTIKQEERITVKSYGNIINGFRIKVRQITENKKSAEPPLKKNKVEADVTVEARTEICDLPALKAKSVAVTDHIDQGIVQTPPEVKSSIDPVEDIEKTLKIMT